MSHNSGRYPYLREVLAPELASLPDEELEQRMMELLPGVSPVELEESWSSFTRSLGRGVQQVGNVLGRAAPGMLQGAMSGAAAGSALGPYGMLAGAIGGAALGGYQSYQASRQPAPQPSRQPQQPPAAPTPAAPGAMPAGPVSQPTPMGMGGGGMGGVGMGGGQYSPAPAAASPAAQPVAAGMQAGGGAANQLLSLLSRPEILQAIMSLAMGQAGRRQVMVGQTAVPTAAIANAVGTLATHAAYQSPQMSVRETESATEYLQDGAGNWLADPGDALSRAEALINLLNVTPPPVIEDIDLEDEIEVFDEAHEDFYESEYLDEDLGENIPDWLLMYIESGDAASDEILFLEDLEFDDDDEAIDDEMELESYDYEY